MAADRFTQEYHLTPNGWVTGTSKSFGQGKELPRPADAVETWEEECYQRSMWSEERWSHEILWHDPSVSEGQRLALHNKFPSPFTDDKRK